MKQDFRSFFFVKALALLLAVVCGVGAFFCGLYCLYYSDNLLWENGSYASSAQWYSARNQAFSRLTDVLYTYDMVRRGETLGYLEEKNYKEELDGFLPEATNFRFIVRDNDTGELLFSSRGEDSLAGVGTVLNRQVNTTGTTLDYYYREYSTETNTTVFYDWDNTLIATRQGNVDILTDDPIYHYALEYGITDALTVEDEFYTIANTYETVSLSIETVYWTVGLTVAFLLLTVFLMCCAGRRREAEDFTLSWADKLPYDLFFCVLVGVLCLLIALCFEIISRNDLFYDFSKISELAVLFCALLMASGILCGEELLMSTAARFKCHTLLSNTLTAKVCRFLWRLCKKLWHLCKRLWRGITHTVSELTAMLPLTSRVIGFGLGYLAVNAFLAAELFLSRSAGVCLLLLCLFNGFALFFVCRWTVQWQKLRAGTVAIVGGAPDTHIDTAEMKYFPALRAHAEALNDLGGAINTAVEERLKSERMKAELITNVSHDLKTPLTSIISYVDLLKKEDIREERAREYIDVLDRKSQRLKKLTEDLVEASKASTGALTVNPERLGMVQLVTQALGEYSERLSAAGLTLVSDLPDEELYVRADGRHLWRILDNLLGNCIKYALRGTRVYLELTRWDGNVQLSLKNISASQLNVPAEELMERFVRGDESRTDGGSGLGLSIARSLTELQGGTFHLTVDGDLFKATVILGEA